VVLARSGVLGPISAIAVHADWLKEQGGEVTVSVEHAALDPFRGCRNAIPDELPETVVVLDAFHVVRLARNTLDVVRLARNTLDEVRRRVQQASLGRRGQDDPALPDPTHPAHRC
jgi:transposase